MKSLFIYIFGETFFIYEKIYADKDHPQYFSASIVAFALISTITVLIDFTVYSLKPSVNDVFSTYYKYFSLSILLLSWWYFTPKRRYKKVVDQYNKMSQEKKRLLAIISVIYLAGLMIAFFTLGDLIRLYNLGEL